MKPNYRNFSLCDNKKIAYGFQPMWSCYNFPQKHREFLTFAYGSSQGLTKNANVSALDLGFTLAVGHKDLSRDQNAGIQGLPQEEPV